MSPENWFSKAAQGLEWLFYRVYAIFFSSKNVRFDHGQFRLLTGTSNEAHRAFTFFSKEPETLEWIDSFRDISKMPDFVLFDIGANIGIYSLYARAKHQSARVYAFEPESQSFASLCRNISSNSFDTILPFQVALSNAYGLGTLFVSSLNAGAGASALGERHRFTNAQERPEFKQGVFNCSMDQIVFEFGLPQPNFIKIDVDGIEVDIILSSKRVLSQQELHGLLVEFNYENTGELDSIIAFLASCGLKLQSRSTWISSVGKLKSQNFIFTRISPGQS